MEPGRCDSFLLMDGRILVAQIVHIEGPMKGEIQEFTDPVITFGRSPDCTVTFPKELKAISRIHAELRREGNSYRLIDRSTNGTFVQGKRVTETILRDGDVITFTEGGPKISFLAEWREEAPEPGRKEPPPEPRRPRDQEAQKPGPPEPRTEEPPRPKPVAFTIVWAGAARTFEGPAVRIGSDLGSELYSDRPGIAPHHLEIRSRGGHVWVKDLTGEPRCTLNGLPLADETVVREGDSISLTPEGPLLVYSGGGRFVQKELPPKERLVSEEPEAEREAFTGPEFVPHRAGRLPEIPVWVLVAAGTSVLVALVVWLVVKLTS